MSFPIITGAITTSLPPEVGGPGAKKSAKSGLSCFPSILCSHPDKEPTEKPSILSKTWNVITFIPRQILLFFQWLFGIKERSEEEQVEYELDHLEYFSDATLLEKVEEYNLFPVIGRVEFSRTEYKNKSWLWRWVPRRVHNWIGEKLPNGFFTYVGKMVMKDNPSIARPYIKVVLANRKREFDALRAAEEAKKAPPSSDGASDNTSTGAGG